MKFYSGTGKKIAQDNLREFLVVKNETLTSADLYFYGDIVSDWWGAWTDSDQYPEAIRDFLKQREGKALNIYINSGGGSVFAGIAIYNMLKRHTGYKTVYIDGMAASIASVIALAGDKVVIPANAFMMIHKPSVYCDGNANEFRKLANDLDVIESGILAVYEEHMTDNVDISQIKAMVADETWLNGTEAAQYFKVETVAAKRYAARLDNTVGAYNKVPAEIIKSTNTDTNNKADGITAQITALAIKGITKGV